MTKKHFEAFAAHIKDDMVYGRRTVEERVYAANLVAMVARQFNPNFDRSRFYTACGLKDFA